MFISDGDAAVDFMSYSFLICSEIKCDFGKLVILNEIINFIVVIIVYGESIFY
jgi:hypothetical protein